MLKTPKGRSYEIFYYIIFVIACRARLSFRVKSDLIPEVIFSEIKSISIDKILSNELLAKKHYLIGYPATSRRLKLREDPDYDKAARLRWSEGEHLSKSEVLGQVYINSDSDSLPGNSGGPYLTETGELMGIVSGTNINGGNGMSELPLFLFFMQYSRLFPRSSL